MTALAPASQWILAQYRQLESDLHSNLETYTLGRSVDSLYKYVWDMYADWYVEYLKTDSTQVKFAKELYTQMLVLLHPYMPAETEVLWREFAGRETLLAQTQYDAEWSQGFEIDEAQVAEFKQVTAVIERVRSLRGLFAIDPATKLTVVSNSELLHRYAEYLRLLGKTTLERGEAAAYTLELLDLSIDIKAYIPDTALEVARTQKLTASLAKQITSLEGRLGNEKFLANATPEAVTEARENLAARRQELETQERKLELLD